MSSSLHFLDYSHSITCNQSCNDYLWMIGPCMSDYMRSAVNSCGHCQPLNAFNGGSHSLLIAGNPCWVSHSWLQRAPSASVNEAIIGCLELCNTSSPNYFLYYWTTCPVIPGPDLCYQRSTANPMWAVKDQSPSSLNSGSW